MARWAIYRLPESCSCKSDHLPWGCRAPCERYCAHHQRQRGIERSASAAWRVGQSIDCQKVVHVRVITFHGDVERLANGTAPTISANEVLSAQRQPHGALGNL